MTEPPTTTDDTDLPAAPVRKPTWRRVLRWAGYGLLGLVVLLALVVAFLHTAPGQNLVRGIIEDRLGDRVDGEVELGELDFALFGDIHLGALTLRDAQGREALVLDGLDVSLDWGSLLGDTIVIESLAVDGLHVTAHEDAPGQLNLSTLFIPDDEPSEPLDKTLELGKLDIDDIDFTLHKLDGSRIALQDLSLDGSLSTLPAAETLGLDIATLSLGLDVALADGTAIDVPTLKTAVSLDRQGEALVASLQGFSADATVSLPERDAPVTTTLAVGSASVTLRDGRLEALLESLEVSAVRLAKLSVSAQLPNVVAGEPLRLSGDQTLALQGLHIDAAELNAVLGKRVLASDVQVDVDVAGPTDALVLTGSVRTDGGNLALRGTSDVTNPLDPVFHIELEGREISTTKLVALPVPNVTSSLDLTVDGHGLRLDEAEVDITLEIGPTTIDRIPVDGLELVARLERGRYQIKKLVLRAFGQEIRILGAMETNRSFRANIGTTTRLDAALDKLRDAQLVDADFELPVAVSNATVDLTVSGTPRDTQAPEIVSRVIPPDVLAKLPIASGKLEGTIALDDLVTKSGIQAGHVDTDIDLSLGESGPFGTIAIGVDALDTEQLDLDRLDATVGIQDDVLTIEIKGVDGGNVIVDVLADARPAIDSDDLVIELRRARVARGRFQTELLEPATLRLPRTLGPEPVTVTVPPIALALAGGRIQVAGTARVHRDPPPPDSPEGTEGPLAVDDFDLALDLSGLDISRAAALAGRRVPVTGTVGGRVALRGTPENPDANLALDARVRMRDPKTGTRAERSLDVAVRGVANQGRVDLAVTATPRDGTRGEPALLNLELAAPLRTDGTPGLASRGRLALDLNVHRRPLGELLAFVPSTMVPEGLDPRGTVELDVDIDGTPARPDGHLRLDLEGELLALVDPAKWAGRTQRVLVGAKIGAQAPDDKPGAVLDAEIWLDADKPRTVNAHAEVTLERSPLVSKRLELERWMLDLDLAELDLARIPPPDPSKPLPGGRVTANLDLEGTRDDVGGTVTLGARGIDLRSKLPAIDADVTLSIAELIGLDSSVRLGGKERLTLGGTVDLSGQGLLARIQRDRDSVLRSGLDLRLTIPEHDVAEWAELAPQVAELPGRLGGDLHITDRIEHPQLDGGLAWHGFTALDGKPGRVDIALALDDDRFSAGIGLGATAPGTPPALSLGAWLSRADADRFLKNEQDRLALHLEGSHTDASTLRRLAPDFAIDGDAIDVDGRIELALSGLVELVRGEDGQIARDTLDFDADLAVLDAAVGIPGSDRRFHGIEVVVHADPQGVDLTRIEAHEADMEVDDRSLRITGRLDMADLAPQRATLAIDVDRWLGTGTFDSPEAAISADVDISADLSQPGKTAHIVVHDLMFDATTRYPRGHFFQALGEHDIIWTDAEGAPPVGKLAVGHGSEAAVEVVEATPAPAPDPDAPTHVITVDIEKGKAIRDVLVLEPRGQVIATIGPDGLALDGLITMDGGSLDFAAATFQLEQGTVTLGGEHAPVWLDLRFTHEPGNYSKRAIAGNDLRTTVQVLGDPVGNDLIIRGAGGPTLETSFSTHIGQTPLQFSGPDMPASQTVASPEGEMQLIQSYMGTNLPHMLFLDHAVAWADPYEWAGGYGELRSARYDMTLHDGSGRLRVAADPPRVAGNEASVHYDWIWGDTDQSIYGMGARLGERAAAGLELFVEWSSVD